MTLTTFFLPCFSFLLMFLFVCLLFAFMWILVAITLVVICRICGVPGSTFHARSHVCFRMFHGGFYVWNIPIGNVFISHVNRVNHVNHVILMYDQILHACFF